MLGKSLALILVGVSAFLTLAHPSNLGRAEELTNDVRQVPVEVGAFGDSKRLVIVGAETFTSDAIRTGLSANAEFLIASHPLAPLDDYLQALSTLVTRGFRREGFPDANVTVNFNAATGNVFVIIKEGPRYFNGDVRVEGAGTLDIEAFTRRLTQRWPVDYTDTVTAPTEEEQNSTAEPHHGPDQSRPDIVKDTTSYLLDNQGRRIESQTPIWERGKPAAFDDESIQRLREKVGLALQDFGYFFAKVGIETVPAPTSATAELHVSIEDLGPKAIVSDLVVTGAARDSRESLLSYLGLKSGMILDRDLITRTERKLWQSARYRRYVVEPELMYSVPPTVNLNIDVTEYETAPGLAAALSSDEYALLRVCDWLSAARSRGDDFVLEVTSRSPGFWGQLVLSQDGAVLTIRPLAGEGGKTSDLKTVLTSEAIKVVSGAQHARLFIPSPPKVEIALYLSLLPEPAQYEATDISFGLFYNLPGEHKSEASRMPPLRLDAVFAPATCMSFARRSDFERSMKNGILSFGNKSRRISINPNSGQLVEIRISAEHWVGRLRLQHAAFDAERRTAETSEVTYANKFAEDVPLNSILSFVIQELLTGDYFDAASFNNADFRKRSQAASVVDGIFGDHPFAPMDNLLVNMRREMANLFWIPVTLPEGARFDMAAAGLIFALVNGLFPRDSWPWVTARESVFVLAGMGEYTNLELERIYRSENVGPIGYLTIAELLDRIGSQNAIPIAQRGLEKIEAENFRKDLELLISRGSTLAGVAERLAASLRGLSEDEVETLTAIMSPETADLLRNMVARSRLPGGQQASDVFAAALDRYWSRFLKAAVEERLRKLAHESSSRL